MTSTGVVESSYRGCALFPGAEVPIKPTSFLPHGAMRLLMVEAAKTVSGGIWVSGRIVIFSDRLAFQPDWISLRMIRGDIALNVPIGDIESVKLRFGIPMGYVDVRTNAKDIFKLKCYRAKPLTASLCARIRR